MIEHDVHHYSLGTLSQGQWQDTSIITLGTSRMGSYRTVQAVSKATSGTEEVIVEHHQQSLSAEELFFIPFILCHS